MDNFNLKKFLVENKLTSNSKMLIEAVEMQHRGYDNIQTLVIPDNIKVQVTDYDEATDKVINTNVTIGTAEVAAGMKNSFGQYYDDTDINPGVEYTVHYEEGNTGKTKYLIYLKLKQVGDKLEVDPTSVKAELPAKN